MLLTLADQHLLKTYAGSMDTIFENRTKYADTNGYLCKIYNHRLSDRPASWDKIRVCLEQMEQNTPEDVEYFMWIDADAVVANMDTKIEDIISKTPDACFIVGEMFDGLNCGTFIVKNCEESRLFFEEVWKQEQFIYNTWWEQMAIIHLLQESYPIKWSKVHNRVINSRYYPDCENHPIALCKIPDYYDNPESLYKDGDFIIHMPGYTISDKYKILADFVKSRRLY